LFFLGFFDLKNSPYYIDVQEGPEIETPKPKKMKKVLIKDLE